MTVEELIEELAELPADATVLLQMGSDQTEEFVLNLHSLQSENDTVTLRAV